MTITNTNCAVRYQGDSVTTVFSYSFLIPDADSVTVSIYDTTTKEITTTSTYSITGLGNAAGGNVTYLGTVLPSTKYIIIERTTPYQQDYDGSNQTAIFLETLESEFDNIVMQTQQNRRDIDQGLRIVYGGNVPGPIPDMVANKALKVNSAGTGLEWSTYNVDESSAATVSTQAASLAVLKGIDGATYGVAFLRDSTRYGIFDWISSDLSAEVTADPGEGLYVAPTSDPTGASGAWLRRREGFYVYPRYWGVANDSNSYDTEMGYFLDALVDFSVPGHLNAYPVYLDSALEKDIGAAGIVFHGYGPDMSRIIWTAGSGGMHITRTGLDADHMRFSSFRDFAVETQVAGGGTGFRLTCSPTLASCITFTGEVYNVRSVGFDESADYWDNGVRLVNEWNVVSEKINCKGLDDINAPFDATTGFSGHECNDCVLKASYIYHIQNAIYLTSSTASYGDGWQIEQCSGVGVGYGINCDGSVENQLKSIRDNHFNAYVAGIRAQNISRTAFNDNSIFKTHLSTQDNWVGIFILGGDDNRVMTNNISTPGAPGGVTNFGVIVSGGDRNVVADNPFTYFTGTAYGVYLTGGAADNLVHDNIGDSNITEMVLLNSPGTGNIIKNNIPYIAAGANQILTVNSTTPSVANSINGFATANTSSTSITNLTDLPAGEEVTIFVNDANTGFTHGTLILKGATNIAVGAASGGFITFKNYYGAIREIDRGGF